MTSTHFNASSLSERIRIILRTGIYLNEVEYVHFKMQLYSVSDFFAEVKITLVGSDVESVRVINGEDVEKFLGNIALPANEYQ